MRPQLGQQETVRLPAQFHRAGLRTSLGKKRAIQTARLVIEDQPSAKLPDTIANYRMWGTWL